MSGIGPMVEGEARVLSLAALTRVFSHLHLRDPDAYLGELLEPVEEGRRATATEALKGQLEAMLKNFLVVDPASSTDVAADPVTPADGTGEGHAIVEGALLASDGGAQG